MFKISYRISPTKYVGSRHEEFTANLLKLMFSRRRQSRGDGGSAEREEREEPEPRQHLGVDKGQLLEEMYLSMFRNIIGGCDPKL